ncbi:MAG TPA: transglycosylase SLT domain-containing protein [Candidatus Binatia bacterium]|nr:transglycosylase SLT domain-containing protein [Candidatus Binatia bacterium]
MAMRTQILVLSLAVGLLQGCAPFAMTLVRSAPPSVESTREITADSPSPQSSLAVEYAAMPATLAQQFDLQEEDLLAPAPLDTSSKIDAEAAPKANQQEAKRGTGSVQNESSVSRNVSGPRAEDRFLNSLEKDLNKTIDRPVERRRLEFSKAVIDNPRVRYFVNQFSKSGRNDLEKILARSGKYMAMIVQVLHEEGVPEDLAYLALIESGFVVHSSSPSGAVGLWQFVPGTARKYGLKIDSWVDERRDPVKSTRAAAAYLKDLHNYFGRWYLAIAAYNAGQGAIEKAMQSSGANDFWTLSAKAKLRDETRNFVPKFVAASLIAHDPQKYGFIDLAYEPPMDYEEMEVQGSLRLASLAEMAGTDPETIRELNPELLRGQTPPEESAFRVKLPTGHATIFAQSYQEREARQTQFVTHEVKKGETLFAIARRYGQHVRSLMELNGLSNPSLRVGQLLKVLIMIDGFRGGILR